MLPIRQLRQEHTNLDELDDLDHDRARDYFLMQRQKCLLSANLFI